MTGEREKLLQKVLKRIKPTQKEIREEEKIVRELIDKVRAVEGPHVEVVLAGSIARQTHLKGDRDIDIFVLFPKKMSRQEFVKEGLKIGKKVCRGCQWEEAYTEHPYIRAKVKGFDVEIVPSYNVSKAGLLQSSVDRSPFHTKYLKGKLTDRMKDEVRLLRQFLKGIGCYGADLKVSSVPGYVTELLVLRYGGFTNVLKESSRWKIGEVIDLENHYKEKDAQTKFDSHFIVVDPVDKNRNVAAALSLNQYTRFIAASRAFLKKPSQAFFFGKKEKPWTVARIRAMLKKKELLAIELGYPKVLADIMWGQLRRLRKKTANQLCRNDFSVVRSDEWTDEKGLMVILIELEQLQLQKTHKRVGPLVTDERNSTMFLEANRKLIVAGPRIENGRWIIEVERKHVDAKRFLQEYLKKAKKTEKANLRKAMNKKAMVLGEKEIIALYSKNKEFKTVLTTYLKGKEEFEGY